MSRLSRHHCELLSAVVHELGNDGLYTLVDRCRASRSRCKCLGLLSSECFLRLLLLNDQHVRVLLLGLPGKGNERGGRSEDRRRDDERHRLDGGHVSGLELTLSRLRLTPLLSLELLPLQSLLLPDLFLSRNLGLLAADLFLSRSLGLLAADLFLSRSLGLLAADLFLSRSLGLLAADLLLSFSLALAGDFELTLAGDFELALAGDFELALAGDFELALALGLDSSRVCPCVLLLVGIVPVRIHLRCGTVGQQRSCDCDRKKDSGEHASFLFEILAINAPGKISEGCRAVL
jgi:hypothetical protein